MTNLAGNKFDQGMFLKALEQAQKYCVPQKKSMLMFEKLGEVPPLPKVKVLSPEEAAAQGIALPPGTTAFYQYEIQTPPQPWYHLKAEPIKVEEKPTAPKYGYRRPGTVDTSPKAVRAAFLKNKETAPTLPGTGYRVGELVRLHGSTIDEYIVLDETRVEDELSGSRYALGLYGGRDNASSFRVVFSNRIKGRVLKPKTKFGRGVDTPG